MSTEKTLIIILDDRINDAMLIKDGLLDIIKSSNETKISDVLAVKVTETLIKNFLEKDKSDLTALLGEEIVRQIKESDKCRFLVDLAFLDHIEGRDASPKFDWKEKEYVSFKVVKKISSILGDEVEFRFITRSIAQADSVKFITFHGYENLPPKGRVIMMKPRIVERGTENPYIDKTFELDKPYENIYDNIGDDVNVWGVFAKYCLEDNLFREDWDERK